MARVEVTRDEIVSAIRSSPRTRRAALVGMSPQCGYDRDKAVAIGAAAVARFPL